MSERWLEILQDPQKRKSLFYLSQIALGVLFAAYFLFLRKGPSSNFRVREAELKKPKGPSATGNQADDLAQSRQKPRLAPLLLEGIRSEGPAHEILGVARTASAEQIQKAYREKMKRYHPDKVGRPGSREWNDAQKIAEALNRAKSELLAALKKS